MMTSPDARGEKHLVDNRPTAAALCMGIGGLDLAAEAHFGCELAWCAEWEDAPSSVIERHWPGVPNLRDLTAIDWADVEPVDVLTAGYPCQPFSHAGKRKGKNDERHLWPYIAEAVRVLRPRWVVLENVAGHLTLGFGDVLRDLAEAGFDAEWCLLRASDVGAPHQRARIFIVATDPDRGRWEGRGQSGADAAWQGRGSTGRLGRSARAGSHPSDARGSGPQGPIAAIPAGWDGAARRAPTDATDLGHERSGPALGRWPGPANSGDVVAHAELNQPGDERGGCHEPDQQHRIKEPTPPSGSDHAPADSTGCRRPDEQIGSTPSRLTLGTVPSASDRAGAGHPPEGVHDGRPPASLMDWGQYALAIDRWEHVLGRPAPRPTDDAGRLSPRFVEWMQGYPEGWVDGLTRTQALKALGNAVVAQQGLAALRELAPCGQRVAA